MALIQIWTSTQIIFYLETLKSTSYITSAFYLCPKFAKQEPKLTNTSSLEEWPSPFFGTQRKQEEQTLELGFEENYKLEEQIEKAWVRKDKTFQNDID